MPNNHVRDACKALGYCCPAAFFKSEAEKGVSVEAQAEKLKVYGGTVYRARRAFREGRLRCVNGKGCLAALWFGKPENFVL